MSIAPRVIAAGVLPFFDDGSTILLGLEYRKVYNTYTWMEFGGKKEGDESLAETACREANEETAGTLGLTLEQVLQAERAEHYVDYYNEKSGVFYRMYCVRVGTKPTLAQFEENAKQRNNEHVEKISWAYFKAFDVIYNKNGILPGTDAKVYSTSQIRLELLKQHPRLNEIC